MALKPFQRLIFLALGRANLHVTNARARHAVKNRHQATLIAIGRKNLPAIIHQSRKA